MCGGGRRKALTYLVALVLNTIVAGLSSIAESTATLHDQRSRVHVRLRNRSGDDYNKLVSANITSKCHIPQPGGRVLHTGSDAGREGREGHESVEEMHLSGLVQSVKNLRCEYNEWRWWLLMLTWSGSCFCLSWMRRKKIISGGG